VQCNNGYHTNEKKEMLPERNGEVCLQVQDLWKVQEPGTQMKNEATRQRMIQKSGQTTQSTE
jgi:hypothetical protein